MLLGSAIAHPVRAQDAEVDSPESLVEQAEPLGIRAGGFLIFPRITADLRYDSNIYNRRVPEIEDFLTVLRPAVRIRPDLARHALELDLAGEVRRFADTTDENSEQFAARLAGRADLAERTTANAHVQIARRIERRGTAGDEFLTDEPVSYLESSAGVGLARRGGRLELSGNLAVVKSSYDDATLQGIPVEQSYRDALRISGAIRGGFRLGQRIVVFTETSANDLDYRHEPDGPRGSTGYAVLAGVHADLGDLAEVEAAVGYLRQEFADPLEDDYDGVDFHLSARWTPSPRLQLAVEGGRSIEPSSLPNATAMVETSLRASGLYALGSNILAGVEVGYEADTYVGIERSERRRFVEGSVHYRINPRLAAFAAAGHRSQDAQGTGARDYSGSTFRIGLTWTP